MNQPRPIRRASLLVGAMCIVLGISVTAYVVVTLSQARRDPLPEPGTSYPLRLAEPPRRPNVMFATMVPSAFKHLALAPLSDPEPARFVADLKCERLYFAASRGVCLTTDYDGLAVRHRAQLFDETFQVIAVVALTGSPSRVRVAPDGRRAAITVFEHGHSYAEDGFSTRTTILDALTGNVLADLEQFVVWRDNRTFRAADFNFWGVTFADGDRFFATLATAGKRYLVEGHVDQRTIRILREGIECPSLSPDGRRLVYKRLIHPRGIWRLHLLELATLQDRELVSETRSVDDQVDWLDDDRVVYHMASSGGADVWVLPVDGRSAPTMWLPMAYSPSVVR